MKKPNLIIMVLFSGMLFFSSCSDSFWNCIEGNGRVATVRRTVGDFNNVASYGNFIVDIKTGSATNVTVEADENLLSYIETYIQGNTLVLETSDNHCLRSREQIYVHVETPSVYEIKLAGSGVIYCDNVNSEELKYVLSGSGKIESDGLNVDFIDADLTGSGEIILSGSASQTNFLISGSGNIKSLDLEQNKCIATISGSGNIYTNVISLLDVQITGSGNVIYKGNPETIVYISGTGRVIRY